MQNICAVQFCHLWPVWLYHIFPYYLTEDPIFGKELWNIKRVFWFHIQLVPKTFLILRRNERDIIVTVQGGWEVSKHYKTYSDYLMPTYFPPALYICVHVKYSLFLSYFNETRIFSTNFQKILVYQISSKSLHWEPSCSMRTGTQTDMAKLIVTVRILRTRIKIVDT